MTISRASVFATTTMRVRNLTAILRVVVPLVLFTATPADAGPPRTWGKCSNDKGKVDVKVRIAACTDLLKIVDGSANGDLRALVLSNRGNGLTDAGEIEKAIADFDAALALQPSLAEAFNGRCWRAL